MKTTNTYIERKLTPSEQTLEVLKLVITAVDRAATTAELNAKQFKDSDVGTEFDCIHQDLEYFLGEMKLCGISCYTTGTKRKIKPAK
jgi:hypothetical protein